MNQITINLDALQHNIQMIDSWMKDHDATWTLVAKVLCGHHDSLRALNSLGIKSMADTRLSNLQAIHDAAEGDYEGWYLRLPHSTAIPAIISLTDVSLNSEVQVIEALNEEAKTQDKLHRIIVMIELGDLREGILPGNLVDFYTEILNLSNIEVLGIGANLGCLSGTVPNVDQLMQLVLYRELLELKFERKMPMISAGSSAVLPFLLEGKVPKAINHFRIGEAAFLGTDLVYGGTLPGLRNDAITLEAEIVEIKEKSLVALGETTTMSPFETFQGADTSPGQRGIRAIVTVGQVDTEIKGLTPIDERQEIAGASSDLTVVNLGDNPDNLEVGDTIRFRPDYAALVRMMGGHYLEKVVTPSVSSFEKKLDEHTEIEVPPVIEADESEVHS